MYPTHRSLKITSLEILIDALLGSSPPWSCTLHVSPNEGNGAMQDSPALVGEFDGDIFLASRRRHGGILLGSKWMREMCGLQRIRLF